MSLSHGTKWVLEKRKRCLEQTNRTISYPPLFLNISKWDSLISISVSLSLGSCRMISTLKSLKRKKLLLTFQTLFSEKKITVKFHLSARHLLHVPNMLLEFARKLCVCKLVRKRQAMLSPENIARWLFGLV